MTTINKPGRKYSDKIFSDESAENIYQFLKIADAPVNEIINYTFFCRSHVLRILHHLESQNRAYVKGYIRTTGRGGKPMAIYAAGPKPEGHIPEALNRTRKSISAIRRLKEYPELGPYAQLLNS